MIGYLTQQASFAPKIPEGFNYTGVADYVLDRGVAQTLSKPLTDEELETLYLALDSTRKRFMMRQCFYNAQIVAVFHPELRYVEGYARGRMGMPVHHAWLTLNGKVIDLTWRTEKPNHRGRLRDRIFGVIPEGWQYIGIEFDAEQIRARMVVSGMACAVIGDWQHGHPCFKQERRSPQQLDETVLAFRARCEARRTHHEH